MTFEKVQKMLCDQLKIDKDTIKMESDIVVDLKADSLDMFYLIMNLEEELKITLSDEDALKMKKVSDIVNFIDNLKK